MAIDPSAVGTMGEPGERAWTSQTCLLYALGVGAGVDELAFTTEKAQKVLPTNVVVLGGRSRAMANIGSFNPAMLVHGEQAIELFGPIPAEGKVSTVSRIAAIWDKGSGAVIATESESTDVSSGKPLFKTRSSVFIRGAGGFGGERGPSTPAQSTPDRKPDHEVSYQTGPDQALLYRLSGDRNPLHSDPEFAKRAGFDRPILHGLCTYGFTGRALLHALCGSDPARFKSMEGRFSKPVFPGQKLTVAMWVDGGQCVFQTRSDSGEVVLDHGRMIFDQAQ